MTTHAMEPHTVLDSALARAAVRIRVRTLLRFGGRALCWSAVPSAFAVALSKLQWYQTPPPALLAGFMSLAVISAVILALTRPLAQINVAKLTERKTDLKERLSSAVEFRALGLQDRFYLEQIEDASHHAGAINLKNAFPIKLPWELPVGVLCAVLVFLTFYLPTLPRFWSDQKKQEMAEVKRQGIEIEKLAKDTEKAADQQKLAETKKAAAEAKKLGEQMHKGKLTKKESLVALAKLTKHMEETQKKLAQPPAKKTLDEAHKDFQKALDKLAKEKEDEARKADEMKKDPTGKLAKTDVKKPADKMAPKPKESEAMRQTKQALQQMADALANQDNQQMQQAMQKMAQQMQKGEMSKEEMKQLQQALQELAQSLKDTNQQDAAQQMQQLGEMMKDGGSMDSNSLGQFAGTMDKIGQMMGKGQNMMQLMDGKALEGLAQMLKDGRLTLAMGKMGQGLGGYGPGKGYNGMGHPTSAMKDPEKTSPRLTAIGVAVQHGAKGKQGSAAEFASYLAKTSGAPKHLPNGKVAGVRSENGNELQMSMTGDPQAARSNSPYYQVVESSKKQAESTLSKENIPASLKKQVKDYFDSIKP